MYDGSSPFTGGTNNPNVSFRFSSGEKNDSPDIKISRDGLHSQFNFMLGRIKTVLDASVVDSIQNKALKDLVSQEVWHRYNYLLEVTEVGGKIINDGTTEIA